LAVVGVLVVLVAVLVLRRGPQTTPDAALQSAIINGEFSNDSLGVLSVRLPPQRGWSLTRDPAVLGRSFVTAEHSGGTASWKLFVTPAEKLDSLDDVIQRRRDQLASMFGATDLDQVIGQVLNEDVQERDGFPAMQWQAISQPVDVAGGEPIYVVLMWVATLRENFAYEGVGLLRFPADGTPQQRASSDSLLNDMAFLMESMQFQ
jgi:hypothetical protein